MNRHIIKRLFFLSLVLIPMLTTNCQVNSDTIEAKELISILSTGDFPGFRKIATLVGYPLAESSKEKDGSISYITRERKVSGNTLGISMTDKNVITMLNYSSYDKEIYDRQKKQIKAMNFVSAGLYKKSREEETGDFEKNKILISTSAEIIDKRPVEYTFYFLK
ncbi:MAG: hypothetical protein ABI688_08060 [Bacteroidota bacterium]